MLVIRMQRTGRKGHAMFRVIVQDSRRTPTSGKVVAQLGSYDPHNKTVTLDKEKAAFYIEHGAQPSERVALLLKGEGVKLPKWVELPGKKKRTVRNADKRRSTRPPEPKEPEAPVEPEVESTAVEEATVEEETANKEETSEVKADEPVAEADTPESETVTEPEASDAPEDDKKAA